MDEQPSHGALDHPERLRTLRALGLLDSPPDSAFDRLTQLAARLLRVPVSLISLVDADRQYFKSTVGLPQPWSDTRQTPLSHSLCQYVVVDRAPFVVSDARLHPRLAGNRGISELNVIAYAGVPLITPEGAVLGALCAIDHEPRDWPAEDLGLLQDLAAGVMTEIALSRAQRAEQHALAEQRRTEASLVAVMLQLPDPVWSVDRDFRLVTYNPAYAQIFRSGRRAPPQPGTALVERIEPSERARWHAYYERALRGEAFVTDVQLGARGTDCWYELSFSPVVIDAGAQAVLVVARNISDRREKMTTLHHLAEENARLYAAERAARMEAEQAAMRTAQLHAITAALAEAREPGQVAEVVVGQGIGALGAYAGALLLRGPDGQALALARAFGYPPEVIDNWPSQAVSDPYPVAEAVRTGQAVWLGSLAAGARRYPHLPVAPGSPTQALAAIPLVFDGAAMGAIALSFDTPQAFPEADRAFALALADQCAQALDRARLFESLQRELAERQRAEVALRDNEARLDGVLRSAMDAIITVDAAQCIVRFNHAAEQLFGVWAEDMIGKPLDLLIPARYREGHRRSVVAFGAGGGTSRSMRAHQTLTALRASGEEFPIEAAISHVAVAGEDLYTVILRDISARLEAEAALKASEARFTAFMERIPAAAWICGADGVVRYVNPSYCQLFAPASDAPLGEHLRALYPPEMAEASIASNQAVLRSGQPAEATMSWPRADGTPGQFLIYTFPLAAHDTAALVGGVAIDITERVAAEAQQRALERSLLETQKLESLGVLAGGIAHDFNNLLMAILGNVELALLDLDGGHPAYTSVSQIRIASQRAADLTGQMLAYSGRGSFVVAPLDLNGLVQELALLLRASTPKGVTLDYILAPNLPAVEADATQLRQVVMNLVINGAEAIEGAAGQVVVRTGVRCVEDGSPEQFVPPVSLPPGAYVSIEVTDTGCGMDAATRERIFEPFFTTKFTGRGLGLAAVLGIVRAHNGAIQIVSAVGQGTTITVLIPASAAAPAALGASPLQGAAARQATLLIIDDEPEVRQVTARMLERLGYQVLAAADGEAGLALLAEHPGVSCVLLDLTMPGLSGEETLRRLRSRRADLPVVVVSGYSATEVHSRVGAAGAVEVLQKPFTPAALSVVLSQLGG